VRPGRIRLGTLEQPDPNASGGGQAKATSAAHDVTIDLFSIAIRSANSSQRRPTVAIAVVEAFVPSKSPSRLAFSPGRRLVVREGQGEQGQTEPQVIPRGRKLE
jgi:hypothetical protein